MEIVELHENSDFGYILYSHIHVVDSTKQLRRVYHEGDTKKPRCSARGVFLLLCSTNALLKVTFSKSPLKVFHRIVGHFIWGPDGMSAHDAVERR